MATLTEKIQTAAAARLVLPEGSTVQQELPRFKSFLKVETHRLKMLHRAGASGREVCQARATILDLLLRHLWEAARHSLSLQARKEFPPLALVALGGYGRGELNPHSDIDFMFLHTGQVATHGKPLPHLARVIDGILYTLWDLGLKVGHSVRTVEECVRIANADMQSKTSLIEARLVIGDARLFAQLEKEMLNRCVIGHEAEYMAARVADQTARREKHGNSATMQEPNIKNGCGGLRDFQNLLWMAWFKYRTRSLHELQEQEFITQAERTQLEEAYDYLLRVRTELHYHANRPTDVLTKHLQPVIAHNLGFGDRSPSRRIEKFMRRLYTCTRDIHLITRTLEQRMALVAEPVVRSRFASLLSRRRPVEVPTLDGFKFLDGKILPVSNRIFRDQPRRLMRAFLHAQQRGLTLHPDLAQLVRNQLDLVDREFLTDEHVRETFITILNQRGNVAPYVRAMHEVGLLGRYLPEFGNLTCLVQHEFYHQYTADEHTLVCLEQLDRVWEAKEPPHSEYTQLLHSLERPFVLYLALLLHDVGKAEKDRSSHTEAGMRLAQRVARRLDLDDGTRDTLNRLIENHLQMARVSQLRDLGDRSVIQKFAKLVGNLETLTLLTLHTFADSMATSTQLWNGFKNSLLWTLYHNTHDLLSGTTEFIRAEEKHRDALRAEVAELLAPPITEEELDAHFAALPARYFQVHSAQEIHDDLLLAHRFIRSQVTEEDGGLAPVTSWHNQPDHGCSEVKVCTWDRSALFSNISGALSASGLNILSAQIFTRSDAIVLDKFAVTDARTGGLPDREQRDQFDRIVGDVLTGARADLRALIARQRHIRPAYQSYEGERMPTRLIFDNETSETRTILEVETEDRLGLLYAISQKFSELGLNISAARICTEKGAAIDSFYVNGLGGEKIVTRERQLAIEHRVTEAIAELDGD